MPNMVNLLIEVVIFSSLIGVIASQILTAAANLTGAAAVLTGLVTLFVVISFIMLILKKSGASTGK